MNTRTLMTSTSLIFGLAGLFALFAPENILEFLQAPSAASVSLVVQLMGALYFSLALMNWTARDSIIGGIYARPISFGNFAHFFSGTLLLIRYVLSDRSNTLIVLMLIVYGIFTILFYWLVFRHTGIRVDRNTQAGSG